MSSQISYKDNKNRIRKNYLLLRVATSSKN